MLEVLKNQEQINHARDVMIEKGYSALMPKVNFFLSMLGLTAEFPIGDKLKSWDVNLTVEFIANRLEKDSAVLDIGAFASEVLLSLSKLGYTNLYGIDLNPKIVQMPGSRRINFKTGNFMHTGYADKSFSAISAISVIEHGYSPEELFSEVSRLLDDGAFFIASFDYWPEKINTSNQKIFGMDWLIFSKEDVDELIACAARHDLYPLGEINYKAASPPIHYENRDYTFAWIALQKKA